MIPLKDDPSYDEIFKPIAAETTYTFISNNSRLNKRD